MSGVQGPRTLPRRHFRPDLEHLYRRASFGLSLLDPDTRTPIPYEHAVGLLVDYDLRSDDVDLYIDHPDYAVVRTSGAFAPNTVIADARKRWLFRMVHSRRPLQEKMTLFWHNHFATGYTKIAGLYGSTEAARMMSAKKSEDAGQVRGQIELLRDMALGRFRDILIAVAQDPAMIAWLDGRLNVKNKPQENFAREVMELFTFGIGNYTEQDVATAARVFSGWNLKRIGASSDPAGRYEFFYDAGQHETAAKTFSFTIYSDGGKTIPARSASAGIQDGVDFLDALARHPETARRLARKLWAFFVSETADPEPAFVGEIAAAYAAADTDIRTVVRRVLLSEAFRSSASRFARYSWPVEFVAKTIREVGWKGYALNDALTPLSNMGQTLYDPPDVSGWDLGPSWFSSGTMLARANFAAALAKSQKTILAAEAKSGSRTAADAVAWALERIAAADFSETGLSLLRAYLEGSGGWTGSDAQLSVKIPGLIHLVAGSAEAQVI